MNLALDVRPVTMPSAFAELAAGVCWKPEEMIAMLWAYFDESGEHGPKGGLQRLTIGGLIAPIEAWREFDEEWGDVLGAQGMNFFHRRAEGAGRDDRFMRIIGEHVGLVLGFSAAATNSNAETYEISFVDCLLHLANASARTDAVSVVFAKHPEFHSSRGDGYREIVNWRDARLASIAFDDPKRLRPLQAADLVAHALRSDEGVRRLKEAGCKVFRFRDGRPVS
jgi:Protein of unknown function (DUF3800)